MQIYLHLLFTTYMYQCPQGSFNTHLDGREKTLQLQQGAVFGAHIQTTQNNVEVYSQMV